MPALKFTIQSLLCLFLGAALSFDVEASECAKVTLETGLEIPAPRSTDPQVATASSELESIIKEFGTLLRDYRKAIEAAKLLNKLPESLQKEWLLWLGQRYWQVPKERPIRPHSRPHISERRLIERLIFVAFRPDEMILSDIADRSSPYAAYKSYLERQREVFATGYDMKEVWLVIEELQKALNAHQVSGPSPALILAGSFVNGKAGLKTSDIDVSLNLATYRHHMQEWLHQASEAFHRAVPGANMEFVYNNNEPPEAFSRFNPVVIRILRDRVELLIFDPGSGADPNSSNFGGKKAQVFELKKN